jgi:hypothetical protein
MSFELGLAAGLCALFLIYGAWLCVRELLLRQAERKPQREERPSRETPVNGAKAR